MMIPILMRRTQPVTYIMTRGGGGVAMTVILHTATMWIVRMIMMG